MEAAAYKICLLNGFFLYVRVLGYNGIGRGTRCDPFHNQFDADACASQTGFATQ